MTAITGQAFIKGNEFANYTNNNAVDSTNGPIAISSQNENEKSSDYPYEPKSVKMTEYKSGSNIVNNEPVESSRYAGISSGEKLENVSNILGRKSSPGENYSEDDFDKSEIKPLE